MSRVDTNLSISSFIQGFGGGLRPNRFIVSIDGTAAPFHVRAASLPSATTNEIAIPYRGRVFKMPGSRSYSPWNITVLDDTSTNLWGYFHTWANNIFSHTTNVGAGGNFTGVMAPITVQQLHLNGGVYKTMTLENAWPSEVGEVRLSMDDSESLSVFSVTLQYSGYYFGSNRSR